MSVFPFISGDESAEEREGELPPLKEYAYDFENNELLLDEDGHTYMAEGNEALRIWIWKALTTERFHYTAYSFAFGTEHLEQLAGRAMNTEILRLEIERFIIEALMVNPYILRLDNFEYHSTATGLEVVFECTSIYGADKIPMQIREVRM